MERAPTRDWAARWVWPAGEVVVNSYTYFRAELEVDNPEQYRLHISADSRYRLWVNGTLLGDGPPSSLPRLVYYDTHDLTPYLRPGRNCLAVIVRYVGASHPALESHRRPGFLAECESDDGVALATGSDGWRCMPARAWLPHTFVSLGNYFDPYQEVFDARREPPGWREVGFDEGEWRGPDAPSELPPEFAWIGWKDSYKLESYHRGVWQIPEVVAEVTHQLDSHGLWASVVPRPIPPVAEEARRPQAVVAVEECLRLENRYRPDLSILLSQAGRPLGAAKVDHPDRLSNGEGPVVLASSEDHLRDRTADGVYDPCVLLDLGQEQTAYVEIDVEGPAGAVVDIGVVERLIDGHFNNAIEGQFATRYILREGRQRWRTSAWRGFRYLRLRLTEASTPVTLHDLRTIVTHYPFEMRGSFTSSDACLEGVFEMCRHTIQLCCHDSIMDTPWREQAQWLGDVAAVTVGGIYACFGDTALAEKFFRQAAATQYEGGTLANISNASSLAQSRSESDIPDYSLWWVIALLEHYRYSGNAQVLRDLFAVVRDVLDGVLAHRNERGLVRSFGWVFIDWADVDKSGECAAFNAILHGSLSAGIEMAELVNSASDAERWSRAADKLRSVFLARFWNNNRGVVADAVSENGLLSEQVSEHANFAAIRFGLLPNQMALEVITRLLVTREVDATEAQPFFTAVVLDALHDLGRTDLALEIIRDRWGKRMLERGATSCYEEWGFNGSWRTGSYRGFMRSLSHAWSAHPAEFLVTRLAGIEIVEPGCRVLRITPAKVELNFHTVFPTPHGPVTVLVEDGDAKIEAPVGVSIIHR